MSTTTGGSPVAYPYCSTCGGFHPVSTGGCPIQLVTPPHSNPPAGTPTRCPTCNHPQLAGVPCAVCGINAEVAQLLVAGTPNAVDNGYTGAAKNATVWPIHASTPNAVKEAKDRVLSWMHSRGEGSRAVDELIAAVRAECAADYLEKMSQDPESAVAAQMARTQAFADVRRVVGGLPRHVRYVTGYTNHVREVVDTADLTAALDALSSEGT